MKKRPHSRTKSNRPRPLGQRGDDRPSQFLLFWRQGGSRLPLLAPSSSPLRPWQGLFFPSVGAPVSIPPPCRQYTGRAGRPTARREQENQPLSPPTPRLRPTHPSRRDRATHERSETRRRRRTPALFSSTMWPPLSVYARTCPPLPHPSRPRRGPSRPSTPLVAPTRIHSIRFSLPPPTHPPTYRQRREYDRQAIWRRRPRRRGDDQWVSQPTHPPTHPYCAREDSPTSLSLSALVPTQPNQPTHPPTHPSPQTGTSRRRPGTGAGRSVGLRQTAASSPTTRSVHPTHPPTHP